LTAATIRPAIISGMDGFCIVRSSQGSLVGGEGGLHRIIHLSISGSLRSVLVEALFVFYHLNFDLMRWEILRTETGHPTKPLQGSDNTNLHSPLGRSTDKGMCWFRSASDAKCLIIVLLRCCGTEGFLTAHRTLVCPRSYGTEG
jgi:hypothetical protein